MNEQAMEHDGQAAHQLVLEQEQQESEVIGYRCPFCDNVHAKSVSDCDGTDIACCGEVGECEPYTRGHKLRDESYADDEQQAAMDEWEERRSRTYRTSSSER